MSNWQVSLTGGRADYDGAGLRLDSQTEPGFWAQLTSVSGSAYAWTEVIPAAGGGFQAKDNARSGTTSVNPAYEIHGIAVPNSSYVWLTRGYLNATSTDLEYLFDAGAAANPPTTPGPTWNFNETGGIELQYTQVSLSIGVVYSPISFYNTVTFNSTVYYGAVAWLPLTVDSDTTVLASTGSVYPANILTFDNTFFRAGPDNTTAGQADVTLRSMSTGQIICGNGGTANIATVSGDASLSGTGVVTVKGIQNHDVDSSSPSDAEVLIWDAALSKYIPQPIAGDVSMSNVGDVLVQKVQGIAVSATAPTDAQVWIYSTAAGKWVPETVNGDVSWTALGDTTVKQLQGIPIESGTPTDASFWIFDHAAAEWKWFSLTGDISCSAGGGVVVEKIQNNPVASGTPPDFGLMVYDATNTTWSYFTLAGDVTISSLDRVNKKADLFIQQLQGKNVSATTPSDGQVLTWVAGNNDWEPKTGAVAGTIGPFPQWKKLLLSWNGAGGTINCGPAGGQVTDILTLAPGQMVLAWKVVVTTSWAASGSASALAIWAHDSGGTDSYYSNTISYTATPAPVPIYAGQATSGNMCMNQSANWTVRFTPGFTGTLSAGAATVWLLVSDPG